MQEPRIWLVHMSCRGSLDFSLDKGWMLWWSWLGCLRVTSDGGMVRTTSPKTGTQPDVLQTLLGLGPDGSLDLGLCIYLRRGQSSA